MIKLVIKGTVLESRTFQTKKNKQMTCATVLAEEGLFKVILSGNGLHKGDRGTFVFDALRQAVFSEYEKSED